MITFFVWVLLLMNILIFILCWMLLKIRPTVEAPKGNHHSFSYPYNLKNTVNIDHSSLLKREESEIQIRYPEIPILFERIENNKAYILRFQGISKEDAYVLYVFQKENAKNAFLNAVETIIEDSKTPYYNIMIAILYDNNNNEEIFDSIKQYNIKYIFTDESEIRNLPETDGLSAFIGVGRKPFAILNIQHETDDHEWLSSLNSYHLFDSVYTDIAKEACTEINDTMSFSTNLDMSFDIFFKKDIMYEYMMKFPETISWFLPVIDKADKDMVVYSPNEESLTKAINQIIASASKHHIDIHVEKKVTHTNLLEEDGFYEVLKENIHQKMHTKYEIPILIENYAEWNMDVPVVSFAPLEEGQVTNIFYAINFYTNLLLSNSYVNKEKEE